MKLKTMKIAALLFGILWIPILTGCGHGENTSKIGKAGLCDRRDCTGESCEWSEDCGPCGLCQKGICEPKPQCCLRDEQCPIESAHCSKEHTCVSCLNNGDCAEQAQVCHKGRCIFPKCTDHLSCPAPQICLAYRCRYADLCELKPIYFETKKWDIRADQWHAMTQNLKCMKAYMEASDDRMVFKIVGYADERGPEPYNQDLGEARAKEVAKYFHLQGIPTENLRVYTAGEHHPAMPSAHQEPEYQWNRRVEITFR